MSDMMFHRYASRLFLIYLLCLIGSGEPAIASDNAKTEQGERSRTFLKKESQKKQTGGRAAARAAKLGLGTRLAAGRLLKGDVDKRWIAAAGGNPKKFPGTLRWPVAKGWFVRGYGSGKQGYHLAVDIGGKKGWNVRAAASGIVGYSGDALKGFGNVVIVIHQGGWVTLYAHNSINSVSAGQRVRRGDVLAQIGSTGVAKGPHVHFEFIFDGENCDPVPLFRPGTRYKNRRALSSEKAIWTSAGKKPRGITCSQRRSYPKNEDADSENAKEQLKEE